MKWLIPTTKWAWVRAGVIFAALGAVVFAFWGVPALRVAMYQPQEGDIVFQALPKVSPLVRMIEGATGSNYSHCGVVIRENGEWKVIESIFDVHVEPLYKWVQRGRSSGFAAYRVRDEHRAQIPRFVAELKKFLGRPYDYRYEMNDDQLYCSELAYKAWKNATGQQMGKMTKLGELNWKPYEATIRELEDGPPPLEREIITPKALSEAPQLVEVYRSGM